MNITKEINKIKKDFNENQIGFWRYCEHIFSRIEPRVLSNSSKITFNDQRLSVSLYHNSDENTAIEFNVDKHEIYIVIAGIGKSMFMVFPSAENEDLYINTALFVEICVKGYYFKKIYCGSDGRVIKEELIWKDNRFKKTTFYKSLLCVLRSFFEKKVMIYEINFASFVVE